MKINEDTRPIYSAWTYDGQMGATVGSCGVTAITPYEENGQGAPVYEKAKQP